MTDEKKDPYPENGEDGEEIRVVREEPSGGGISPPEEDEAARLRSQLAYLAAEFDNYRKRTAREKETIVSFGNERLLRAVLPFLDNLERAISQSGEPAPAEAILSGVRMTYEQILGELRKFGLEQIRAEGETFDPNLHEAVGVVRREGCPDGTVVAESRRGYLLNGRLLRPAHVTVAQAPSPSGEPGDGEEGLPGPSGREG